jgi:hypothetical protein
MPTFENDIKPLFRSEDRLEMLFHIDLWKFEDVRDDAENIYERVLDGTMPCDVQWAPHQVALLRSWIDTGCPE